MILSICYSKMNILFVSTVPLVVLTMITWAHAQSPLRVPRAIPTIVNLQGECTPSGSPILMKFCRMVVRI